MLLYWDICRCENIFRDRYTIYYCNHFPGRSDGKDSACNAGDSGLIPWFGRSPGEGNGYPLQYSRLENSMDSILHGAEKSWTWLSDFHKHYIQKYYLLSYILSYIFHDNIFSLECFKISYLFIGTLYKQTSLNCFS